MAIIRRGEAQPPARRALLDPFRQVRELLLEPFQGVSGLPMPGRLEAFEPRFDLKETPEGYVLDADLPGVREEDLEVSLSGRRLTVSGKREAEHEERSETVYTYERSFGRFSRSFELPGGIDEDHVQAHLEEGVLHLVVPKKEAAAPKKISVGGKKGQAKA